ncbi:MAG: hypothetical protein RSA17_08265 [Ruthenibacterium sp.]
MANLLVVADEKAITDFIRMNLKPVDHTATTVSDGLSAIEMCKTPTFD